MRIQPLIALILSAIVAVPQPVAQKASRDWKRITVDNFEVVGTASPKELTEAMVQIHSFRSALDSLLPGLSGDKGSPTTLIAFGSSDAFERFLPRDGKGRKQYGVGGYFTDLPDRNFMVIPMSGPDGETYETAFHEYTHYVISRRAANLPAWLDEGLSEFYSTYEIRDGYGLVGLPPAGRRRWLNGPTRVPHVRQLLTGDPGVFETFGGTLGFYAMSWLTVHYMILGEQGRHKEPFARYLDRARTLAPEAAAREAFGKSFDDVDRAIRQYGQRAKLPALRIGNPVSQLKVPPVEPLTHLEALTLQARLLLEVGGTKEAEPLVGEAVSLAPSSPTARLIRGRLRLAQRRYREALEDLATAVAAAPESFSAHYYRGLALYEAGHHEAALEMFDSAIELNNASAPTWFGLSVAALALDRIAQSETMLGRARRLDARPRWYYRRAVEAVKHHRDEVAVGDARTFIELSGPADDLAPYAAFLGAVAAGRLGRHEDGRALLERVKPLLDPKSWPKTLFDYMSGALDEQAFLRRARNNGERTEARTYVALRLLEAGRTKDAVLHLEWVRDHGERNYSEFDLALAELRRLDVSSEVRH